MNGGSQTRVLSRKKLVLLIELSRLRIESFFFPSIPFLPYHRQLGRNPCDGSKVLSNILRTPREIHCCHCDLVVKAKANPTYYEPKKVLFHAPEVFEPWHFESR